MTRPTLVCPHCFLTQFRTKSGDCRRCRRGLDGDIETAAAVAIPSKVQRRIFAQEAWERCPDEVIAFGLWYFRERLGVSQKTLAERMNVPRTFVSKVETGRSSPTLTSMFRQLKVLEVEAWYFMRFCEEVARVTVVKSAKKEADYEVETGRSAGAGTEGLPVLCDEGLPDPSPEAQCAPE